MLKLTKTIQRFYLPSSQYVKKEAPVVFLDIATEKGTNRVEILLHEHINPESSQNFLKMCEGFKNKDGKTVSYKGKKFVNRLKGYFMETEEIKDTIYGSEGYLNESYSMFNKPWLVGVSSHGDPENELSGSGFFVTLMDLPNLDNNVIVGEVLSGKEALKEADREDLSVTIKNCGYKGLEKIE